MVSHGGQFAEHPLKSGVGIVSEAWDSGKSSLLYRNSVHGTPGKGIMLRPGGVCRQRLLSHRISRGRMNADRYAVFLQNAVLGVCKTQSFLFPLFCF